MDALILAALVLMLLLLTVMLGKRNKLYADQFLIIYLFVSALSQGYTFLERSELMQHSYWMLLGKGLYFVYSPLFFLYVYALTHSKLPRWLYALVAVPLAAYVLHFFYFYLFVFDTNQIDAASGLLYINGALSWSWLAFVILMLVIEPVYLIWFYFILRQYRKRMLASVSNTDRINLNWVQVLFYIRCAIVIIVIPVSLLALGNRGVTINLMQMTIEVVSLISFFIIGYYGFNQTTVFSNPNINEDTTEINSYKRSGLTDEQSKVIHSRLVTLMSEAKPYLNGELSASELAQQAGISVNHLSQVLNTIQKQNFFDFVNTYRVQEVKYRMKDPKNNHLTLLAIALDSGFNSKTSFNTVFRKITGQTPSQYLKMNIEVPA
jgi:AraC-like DNA-binding protein